jgi:hypothetical protein
MGRAFDAEGGSWCVGRSAIRTEKHFLSYWKFDGNVESLSFA